MRKIRVLGTRPKRHPFPIVSWAIRLVEWSDISHVSVQVDNDRVYHAHFNEVGFESFKEFSEKNEIRYSFEVEIPTEQYDQMLDFCDGYKGKKKGYFLKLFGVLIPHFLRAFNIYAKNTFVQGMEENSICSELVRYLAVHYWNFDVDMKIHPENFTTMDVINMMKNN